MTGNFSSLHYPVTKKETPQSNISDDACLRRTTRHKAKGMIAEVKFLNNQGNPCSLNGTIVIDINELGAAVLSHEKVEMESPGLMNIYFGGFYLNGIQFKVKNRTGGGNFYRYGLEFDSNKDSFRTRSVIRQITQRLDKAGK